MFLSFLLLLGTLTLSLFTLPARAHEHQSNGKLDSKQWFHSRDHPVHQLFRRDDMTTDGASYPEVGSSAWTAAYPVYTPDSSKLPAAWTDALDAAVAKGSIPNIPPSAILSPNTNPVYPEGFEPTSDEVCSGTYKCRVHGDIWDVQMGCIGTGFDDGPTDASPRLLDFLEANNETVTHFMIGVAIMGKPATFKRAIELGQDIAVHTWTHPYMTTLSNSDVLAQLGWTMQLIHDSTGGRVPKFWRPPYGDTDMRVSAIADEVFDLTTILWNHDTEDWSLTDTGGTTADAINASMSQWLTGPKSPGLIILEHELSNQSVAAFEAAYPVMKLNGWNLTSVSQLVSDDGSAYQNAASINSGDVTPADIVNGDLTTTSSVAATATSQSSTLLSRITGSSTVSSESPKSTFISTQKSPNSASLTWRTIGTSAVCAGLMMSALNLAIFL